MSNVLASAMFFHNAVSAVRMGKDGSIKAIGKSYRECPFDGAKFEKAEKDVLKYITSRTNVQGLIPCEKSGFDLIQKSVNASRKENAILLATSEGFDAQEIDGKIEETIDSIGKYSLQLADEKAVLSALRNRLKAGPGAAEKKAANDLKNAQFKASQLMLNVSFGKAGKATPEQIEAAKAVLAAKAAKEAVQLGATVPTTVVTA